MHHKAKNQDFTKISLIPFQISSNIIVVIALDRLLTVISTAHHRPERAHKRTKIMLLGAWITALLISAPQFAVWRVYDAFKNWSQCMSVSFLKIFVSELLKLKLMFSFSDLGNYPCRSCPQE